jgi:3-mercaptopyruvate sulfurtransferase SseA
MRRKRKNNAVLPIILFVLVIALSVGGFILADNQRQARIANPGEIRSQDQIPRVTAAEAYQAVQSGEAVLLDTRSEAQFAALHATGAINIPVTEVEARLNELDPDTWYITYCT